MFDLFESPKDKAEFISEYKNPFKNDMVSSIMLWINKSMFSPHNTEYSATIEFKNGNTRGEQKIKANDFLSLVYQVEEFIKSLK